MNAQGIDISRYQGSPKWPDLYAGGISFVGAKAAQGATYIDPTFAVNRAGAHTQPFLLDVYYAYAVPGDPVAQANHLMDVTGSLLPGERLCMDMEARGPDNRPALDIAFLTSFYTTLMGAACSDREPLLYVSLEYWNELGNPDWELASDVGLWLKRYAPQPGAVPKPWASQGYRIWQKSEQGTVPGISGPVDLDEFAGDLNALRAYAQVAAVT